MPLYSLDGISPTVADDAFIAPTATLVGDVHVESGASIWYGAVLRADYSPITIRTGANVQDGSVLHSGVEMPCDIGAGATIAHLCLVHSATVGANALIGNHATVLDGARIGRRTLVAAGSLVLAGTEFGDELLITGSPAKVKGPIEGTGAQFWVDHNEEVYRDLATRHRDGIAPA